MKKAWKCERLGQERSNTPFRVSVDLTFVAAVREELGLDLDEETFNQMGGIGTLFDICNAVRKVHTDLNGGWYSKEIERKWTAAAKKKKAKP